MHNLILGGAGTGKTTELMRRYKDSELSLFLSSNSLTPYKLALDIVSDVDGVASAPERASRSKEKKSCFASKKDYDDRLSLGVPISLCGEVMKSFGEVDIANFLFESKIDYIYEHPYKYDTRTEKYAQYRPDFYLPEHDVYIEFFAFDRKGRVPEYFGDAKEYIRSAAWKLELHERNGTALIPLFSYERSEGVLLKKLAAHIKSRRIKIRKRRKSEIYPKQPKKIDSRRDDFAPIIEKAIRYASSGEYRCLYSHIFVDDIDLMQDNCIELIKALSVPISATSRDASVERFFNGVNIIRLEKKYRDPKYEFVFSYTKEGQRKEIIKNIGALDEKSSVFIIGKDHADGKMLVCEELALSYDRVKKYVKVSIKDRVRRNIYFAPESYFEGEECDYAFVLADAFSKGDERAFETALTRAKKGVWVVSATVGESPLAEAFRESLGQKKHKRGFSCPKCGAPLAPRKGRYGEYLECVECKYKKSM